jgi:hypothetical protein
MDARAHAHRRRAAWTCLWVLVLGLGSITCDTAGWVVAADRNGDGRVDAWRYFDTPHDESVVLLDTDYDGDVDARRVPGVDASPIVVPLGHRRATLQTPLRAAADEESCWDEVSADLPPQVRVAVEITDAPEAPDRSCRPRDAQPSIYSGRAPPA